MSLDRDTEEVCELQDARRRAEDAARRTRQLQGLTAALTGVTVRRQAAGVMVGAGRDAVDADLGVAWLLDGQSGMLERVAWDGPQQPLMEQFRRLRSDAPLPLCDSIRRCEAVFIESPEVMQRLYPAAFVQGTSEFEAWAVIPFVVRGQGVGGVVLSFARRVAFSSADRDLLVGMAGQASLALEGNEPFEGQRDEIEARERLAKEAQSLRAASERARRRAEQLQQITAALAQAVSVEEVVEVLGGQTAAILGARDVVVGMVDDSAREVQILCTEDKGQVAHRLPLDTNLPIPQAIRTGESVWLETVASIRARFPDLMAERTPLPRAFAAMPLQVERRSIGAVALWFENERDFELSERDFLSALSSVTAQSLERARLYSEAQRARDDAESANRVKDEFLAMLGHELRNPLSPILTALELMRAKDVSIVDKERTVIERQVGHLVRLVDDLLDVSRITRGKIELRKRPIELADAVARAIEVASPLLERSRHVLKTSVPSQGLALEADEQRLTQVVSNLLTNAAKYTPPGSTIEITAEQCSGSWVSLHVRDSGDGIDPELLPHVFHPFVQGVRPLDRGKGGLGLGLAIVYSLVQLHGGHIDVRSERGQGADFEVRLPLSAYAMLELRAEALAGGDDETPRPHAPSYRVLVVDDNRDAAELLGESLRLVGFAVEVAYDGQSALQVAEGFRPQAALVDIGLPVMDGFEVAQHLRSRLDPLVLVAITGYGQKSDETRSLEAGFDRHLVKPVEFRRVRRLLKRLVTERFPA